MNNSWNPIDLDLVPWNIRDTVDIFGVVGTFTGSWSWPSLWTLYPWLNIYAMLSPLHRISGNYDNVTAGTACIELLWIKYYFLTMALSIDNWTRSTTCVTSVWIDNGWVFTNLLVHWGGTVPFTWTWVSPTFYLDGTDIHISHNTNFWIPQHRYITLDTTTNLFTNTVWGTAFDRHVLWFNNFDTIDNLNSVQATPAWTLISNSFVSWLFTYTSEVIWDNTITNPAWNPIWRTIGGIHVATKV